MGPSGRSCVLATGLIAGHPPASALSVSPISGLRGLLTLQWGLLCAGPL